MRIDRPKYWHRGIQWSAEMTSVVLGRVELAPPACQYWIISNPTINGLMISPTTVNGPLNWVPQKLIDRRVSTMELKRAPIWPPSCSAALNSRRLLPHNFISKHSWLIHPVQEIFCTKRSLLAMIKSTCSHLHWSQLHKLWVFAHEISTTTMNVPFNSLPRNR